MEAKKPVRINKYLSEIGYCSRREADKLIDQGVVTVNGQIPEMGTKINPEKDTVAVQGKIVTSADTDSPTYIAFHKPVGIVCTTSSQEKDNIIDYINYPRRIFPIGRLDKPSEGLILLTSDGDIVNKILRARNHHEKEYLVTVDRQISAQFLKRMANGIPILDTVTRRCEVEQISAFVFRIVLTQGLNRQIRRMCEYLGYEVTKLKRVRIMHIPLDVAVGTWRDLTPKELDIILENTKESDKTELASLPLAKKPQNRTTKPLKGQRERRNRKRS